MPVCEKNQERYQEQRTLVVGAELVAEVDVEVLVLDVALEVAEVEALVVAEVEAEVLLAVVAAVDVVSAEVADVADDDEDDDEVVCEVVADVVWLDEVSLVDTEVVVSEVPDLRSSSAARRTGLSTHLSSPLSSMARTTTRPTLPPSRCYCPSLLLVVREACGGLEQVQAFRILYIEMKGREKKRMWNPV